ncbi:MAG: hypothetical protein U1E17_10285 [Geminicoccaceae bacterium]
MCGIVGLFLKDKALEPQLGALLSDMLITMTDRGPDSASIAIYGAPTPGRAKLTVQSARPATDFAGLEQARWARPASRPRSPSRARMRWSTCPWASSTRRGPSSWHAACA